MKRKTAAAGSVTGGGPVHLAPVETVVWDRFPALIAHCTVTKYEDGSARKTGWLTIKTMGVSWVVIVKDPDGAVSLSATGKDLDDALTLADLLVGADDSPWEADTFLQRSSPKKK
jgi:hypothetical protein